MKLRALSLVLFVVLVLLYSSVLISSLRFEHNKFEFNYTVLNNQQDSAAGLSLFEGYKSSYTRFFVQNPDEAELLLRAQLIANERIRKDKLANMELAYQELLVKRPSWPYYYSGLLRVHIMGSVPDFKIIEKTIGYGSYELKVVKSVAELLFYKWDFFSKEQQNSLLAYLSSQAEIVNRQIVAISAKFAKIYEYCDYIYDQKQVEYAACKKYYWEPLLK